MPKVSWFPGFFNPQSFLTAVMQSTARRNEWPLDKTTIQVQHSTVQHSTVHHSARYNCMQIACVDTPIQHRAMVYSNVRSRSTATHVRQLTHSLIRSGGACVVLMTVLYCTVM